MRAAIVAAYILLFANQVTPMDAPAPNPLTNSARVVLAVSKEWQAADGNPATLANVRIALAKLVGALKGVGFPEPASDEAVRANSETWMACLDAARKALDANNAPLPADGKYAVLWRPNPSNPAQIGPGLPIVWPYQPTSIVSRVFGPVIDASGQAKQLFVFDRVDESAPVDVGVRASPGFWPKSAPDAPTFVRAKESVVVANTPSAKRPWLATALFCAWVASFVYFGLWQWAQGDVAARSYDAMQTKVAGLPDSDANKKCLTLTDKRTLFWTAKCDGLWDSARAEQKPPDNAKDDTPYGAIYRHFWTDGNSTPLKPYLWALAATCLLLVAGGLASDKGLWFGALVDSRNRFSLSRTQQLAWTVVLISAIWVASSFNAILMPKTFGTSLEFIPQMAGALWAALGVSLVASPYLSALVLDAKQSETVGLASDAPALQQVVVPAQLDVNENPHEASWVDLMTGETKGTETQIDVSRVQHLIITGLLLSVYAMLLAKMFAAVSGETIATAFVTQTPPFASLPPVGETFLGLLLLSHGSYLAFKARKTDTDGGAAPAAKKP